MREAISARLQRTRRLLEEHRLLAMLAVMFATFRWLAVPLLTAGGYVTGGGPDDVYYLDFAALSSAGYFPFLGYWSDFPPIFPALAVGAYRLSLALPAWRNSFLLFNTFLRWSLAPFEVGNLLLMYAIARRMYGQRQAEWTAIAYNAAFVPFLVMLGWFDSLVLFFMLLAIWGMLSARPALSGLSIGLGFLTKPFPVAVAPAAAQVFRRWPGWLKLAGAGIVVVVIILVPLGLASPVYTLATYQARLSGMQPYETVWALLDGVIDFGLVASLNLRVDPASARSAFESRLPWMWITAAFVGLGLWLWTRRIPWENPRRSVAFVGLTWMVMLLYSKGFSPQWHAYTVALVLLVISGWRGVAYSVLLAGLMVWEWPLAYFVFRQAVWVAVAVILIRTLVFVALTLDFAAHVFPEAARLGRMARLGLPVAAEVSIVAAIALTPGMLRSYSRIQLERDELAPLVETIREGATTSQAVVTPQHEVVGRLAAPLRGSAPVLLLPQVYDDAWEPPDDWLSGQTSGFERVWLVTSASARPAPTVTDAMETWLGDEWCLVSEEMTTPDTLVHGYEPPDGSGACPAA